MFRLASPFLHIRLRVHKLALCTQGIARSPLNPTASQPLPQPNQTPRNQEDNEDSSQDSEAVARNDGALLAALRVEEAVRVEALGVVGDVCDAEVQQQEQDEDGDGDEGVGNGSWEDDLEQGVEGVQSMLGDLCLVSPVPKVLFEECRAGGGDVRHDNYIG